MQMLQISGADLALNNNITFIIHTFISLARNILNCTLGIDSSPAPTLE